MWFWYSVAKWSFVAVNGRPLRFMLQVCQRRFLSVYVVFKIFND